ncbi:MAG: PDZ domain-containing protein [Candidatus Zixiibacteriota bacterium]
MASGTIQRGYLGVTIQPFSRDYARYYENPRLEGILISDVITGSPAEKAGIKPGDVLMEYNGGRVSAEKEEDLNKFLFSVSESEVGKPAQLKIVRNGVDTTLMANITMQPKVKADEFETTFGFTVEEITDAIYRQYMLEDKNGVMVSFVEVGGAASTAMLDEDDVIKKIESFEIKNLDDLKKSLDQVKDKKQIMLTVKRGKNSRFILLSPEEKKEQAQP